MIKCKVNKDKLSLKMSNDLTELIFDTANILNGIYKAIYSDKGCGDAHELWRRDMIKFLTDPKSPLFLVFF